MPWFGIFIPKTSARARKNLRSKWVFISTEKFAKQFGFSVERSHLLILSNYLPNPLEKNSQLKTKKIKTGTLAPVFC